MGVVKTVALTFLGVSVITITTFLTTLSAVNLSSRTVACYAPPAIEQRLGDRTYPRSRNPDEFKTETEGLESARVF